MLSQMPGTQLHWQYPPDDPGGAKGRILAKFGAGVLVISAAVMVIVVVRKKSKRAVIPTVYIFPRTMLIFLK